MTKTKEYLLNRKMYDRIRKMDHSTMSLFMRDVYKNGYKDGIKDAEGLTIDELKDILPGIKGLGEKRVEAIVSALETEMNEKYNKKE